MGKIRIVLLFDEENEKQRQAGEFLKTQKRYIIRKEKLYFRIKVCQELI